MKNVRNFLKLSTFVFVFVMNSCSSQNNKASVTTKAAQCTTTSKKPTQIWTLNNKFQQPESAVFDPKTKAIYVSNVAGAPNDKDKKGWISKVSLNGKILKSKWVEGLNAPKGLGISGDRLWVSDIDKIVSISISKRKIEQSIEVSDSKFLNDISINSKTGDVYVSDTMTSTIYSVGKDGSVSILAKGNDLENPNGLFYDALNDSLLVAAWGPDIKADFSTSADGQVLKFNLQENSIESWGNPATRIGHLDGIEKENVNSLIISDWMAGKVYRLKNDSQCELLMDGFKGAADIGWIADKKILLVPRMAENTLTAYLLK